MKRLTRAITLLLGLCIFLFGMDACSTGEMNDSHNGENSKVSSDFVFPEKSDFTFSCTIQDHTVNEGENFVISCSLINKSGRDLFIEHGIEAISYSYNAVSEEQDSLAVLDKFQAGEEIGRTLYIKAQTTGTITVMASIRVKPAQYSDAYETYEYNEQIEVVVK